MSVTKTHQTLVWHHPGKVSPVAPNTRNAEYFLYRNQRVDRWWAVVQENVAEEWLDIRVPELGWQSLKTQWTEQDVPPTGKSFLYLNAQGGFVVARFDTFTPEVCLRWLKDYNVQKWALLEE